MIQKPQIPGTPAQLEQTDPAREFNALTVTESNPAFVVQKSRFSEEEARLEEEALSNAVIEIEALSRTAAQAANERSGKERGIRLDVEPVSRPQERQIGERETDFITEPSLTPWTADELQHGDAAGVMIVPRSEKGIGTPSGGLDLPIDVIRRLNSDSPGKRSDGLSDLARLGGDDAFHIMGRAFDEHSEEVRNAAARAMFELQADRAASFARILREGSPERRRRIGAALAASGLAGIAIGNLAGQTREKGYEAFSLLFLMAKAGEVQPLLRAVEDHPNIEVRLAVVKLLALNGQAEIVPSFRQLAVRGVLPSEVRAAVIEAIFELGRQVPLKYASGAKG